MAERPLPTPSELRQLLRYDPETGKLFWCERVPSSFVSGGVISAESRCARYNGKFAGREAFTCRMGRKHLQGRLSGRGFLAHRVIWALVYGEWPKGEIDHINGNPIDNRLSNLRDIPKAENQKNMRRASNNRSGVTGVRWDSRSERWQAEIKVRQRNIYLGRFTEFGDAVKARKAAEARYGFHPNHGRD